MDFRRRRQDEQKQFNEEVISIDRVARVVKGGRRFRFRALVAVGDNKRKVGIGVAKGLDVQSAVTKAIATAKKNMIEVPIDKGTIPHDITVKVKGAVVMLKPAAPGTGIIAGGVVRSILNLTGVENVLSKMHGSNSKINNAYATVKALASLVPKKDSQIQPATGSLPSTNSDPTAKTAKKSTKSGSVKTSLDKTTANSSAKGGK